LGQPDLYQTALGERRVVTLEDGSRISLDSDSAVEVSYQERSRDLRILRGQARFDVAHDVERPFSVAARGQKVIATGTAFNVDLTGGTVQVTLIEGRVTVLDERKGEADGFARPKPVELVAGQQLAINSNSRALRAANLEKASAWERGQLVFENETLTSIVSRVNRYSRTRVVVADAKAGALRISGVFNTGDVNGFVDTVTSYLPVTAKAQGGDIELRSKR
jgi:transmembrane sensor